MKHNPYFSHADRANVVAEHDAKSLTDPLHKAIEADISTIRVKNARAGVHSTRFFDPRAVAKTSTFDAALLVALDYNTVRSRRGGRREGWEGGCLPRSTHNTLR